MESAPKKCDVLVVDSAGFIKNAKLEQISSEIVTVRAVVSEIRDRAAKERLQVTPYEIMFKEPDQEDMKHVTEFSKKTGDFSTLSAVDLRVLALALMMERQKNNGDISHLRTEPMMRATQLKQQEPDDGTTSNLPGFYRPESDSDEETESSSESELGEEKKENSEGVSKNLSELDIANSSRGEVESPQRQNRSGDADSNDASSEGEEDAGEDEDDDDEEGWITPGNIKEKRRLMEGRKEDDAQAHVKVACMTTDYAMQNVLKQLGLNVFSLDGYLIRETRTWNLRCYGCFHVTTEMTRKFCPKCGNKTLKRVAVTRNDDGSKEIHINYKRPLSLRGKKFSLPKQQGGRKAVNPVLCEDQTRVQMKLSRKAMMKTEALDPDYTAGDSPFALHDVTSRSALLGVAGMQTGQSHYWNKKNPNSVVRKTGNRKKKT